MADEVYRDDSRRPRKLAAPRIRSLCLAQLGRVVMLILANRLEVHVMDGHQERQRNQVEESPHEYVRESLNEGLLTIQKVVEDKRVQCPHEV